MISVIIKDNHEAKVIQLTYENLHRELKDIPGSELIVSEDWFQPLYRVKNQYVCFVEPDCLVSGGYFASMLGLFKKQTYFRRLAVFGAATGVQQFGNRFFGYELGNTYSDGIIPVRAKKSTASYPVQISYVPGALIRMSLLMPLLDALKPDQGIQQDLVYFSAYLCLNFWKADRTVQMNPNTTYVTTEDYVNGIGRPVADTASLKDRFARESI